MRILLVAPGTQDDLDSRFVREVPYLHARVLFGPHAIVTVAALTPPGHEVVVHDEHMHGPCDARLASNSFDVVGISLTTNQFSRALAIAGFCKGQRLRAVTVAGGIGAENLMAHQEPVFDVVIHGEAEESWPRFLAELAAGRPQKVYRRFAHPELTALPAPRWDLIAADIPAYGTLSVQTTRGCPHDCDFCDVIYTYGRRPRSKTAEQVLAEVQLLQRLGGQMIFVADDNFGGGDRRYAKDLLRRLAALNNTFDAPLVFMTQVDILVSQDDELLALFADANFVDLMIGIESVNEAALRDMNKLHNLRVDPLDAVRRIQSYGIAVLGHMIIGNDSDTESAFAATEAFVDGAAILHHFCHPLMAPPGTRLWYRLAREGRLVRFSEDMRDRLDVVPNIVPAGLSRVALLEGLAAYWDRVFSPQHYVHRALRFVNGVKRLPAVRRPSPKALGRVLRMLIGVLRFYLFHAGREHRRAFFTILRHAGPKGPVVVQRAIFLYTCFMMDHKRALYDAAVVRDQARREREHPEIVLVEMREIPVAQAVRDNAAVIVAEAYACVRPRVADMELLCRAVVDALVEYSDRFGVTMISFDDYQRTCLRGCCERALTAAPTSAGSGDLPSDVPPAGFSRDVMDALDNAMRVHHQAGGC